MYQEQIVGIPDFLYWYRLQNLLNGTKYHWYYYFFWNRSCSFSPHFLLQCTQTAKIKFIRCLNFPTFLSAVVQISQLAPYLLWSMYYSWDSLGTVIKLQAPANRKECIKVSSFYNKNNKYFRVCLTVRYFYGNNLNCWLFSTFFWKIAKYVLEANTGETRRIFVRVF